MTFETNGQWAQADGSSAAFEERGPEPEPSRRGDSLSPAIAVLALLAVVVVAVVIALS